MPKQTITDEEIRCLPGLRSKCHFISNTIFPLPNVAIVSRVTERNLTKFETVFLFCKKPDGSIERRNVKDSRDTKEYINIRRVWIEENFLHIYLTTWGERTGEPWEIVAKYSIYSFS